MTVDPKRYREIEEKVRGGQRLSLEDGLALEESNDLFFLGSMANLVRERYNGNFGYYNVNTHINPTNVCVYTCDFCAFRADLNSPRAYTMDRDQILERAAQAHNRGATELQICGAKASTETWLNVHRTAHQLGLHSNATMLYGHIDKSKHRIDHMIRLRELQDETGGFHTFIPLAFHPDNSRMDEIPKPSGVMDLKTMAISRLMLDNFPHIKAYWIMLGIKTAQVALSFGADDLDGTVVHETIYHEAGAETPQEITVTEIERLIREAGRIPVERDTLYNRVERDGARWTSGSHIDVVTTGSALPVIS